MSDRSSRRWRYHAFAGFLIVGVVLALTVELPSLNQLRHWTESWGLWSVAAFFLLYVTSTQFPIPRTALTVSSGVLFGPITGIVLALLATTTAAFVSITMLRALLTGHADSVGQNESFTQRWARRQGNHNALDKVNERLEHRGWLSIFSLRLIPGLPFSVLNYACVFTPVKRRDFTIATFFGSAPSTIIGVLLGDAITTGSHALTGLLLGGLFTLGLIGIALDLLLPVKPSA